MFINRNVLISIILNPQVGLVNEIISFKKFMLPHGKRSKIRECGKIKRLLRD